MSKKRTKTERVKRQLDALDLLARISTLPPALEFKRIRLHAKLMTLYQGAAKRQMQGLVTRELHNLPPFERYVVDRSVPEPVTPTKYVWVYSKSSLKKFNAVVRGQFSLPEKHIRMSGFGIYPPYKVPVKELNQKFRKCGSSYAHQKRKMRSVLDHSIEYSFQDVTFESETK